MLRRLLLVLVLLVIGCSCSANPRALAPGRAVVAHVSDATAILIAREEGHIVGICSAVWVGQVDLLTAAHCAKELAVEQREDPVGGQVEFARRSDVAGRDLDEVDTDMGVVVAIDEENDLALLSARRTSHGVAELYRGLILQGDPVVTLGHTVGLPFTLTVGVVSADRRMHYDDRVVHVLQVFCGANFGDSGGGAWTPDGELLGVGSFRRRDAAMLFYVHRDVVLAFLKREAVL